MGLDSNACRLLLLAKRRGAVFTQTLTLGRLALRLNRRMMRRIFDEFSIPTSEPCLARVFSDPLGFSEPFLHELGAKRIDSVDATNYEGASIVQDLNSGLPQSSLGKYDAVIDGGTLEHVFNFPAAFKGSMSSLRVGGCFLLPPNAITPWGTVFINSVLSYIFVFFLKKMVSPWKTCSLLKAHSEWCHGIS